MISIRDVGGRYHYLSAKAIASVSQPSTSSAWHGIRAIVKLFDGTVLESTDDYANIARQIEADGEGVR